MRTKQWPFPDGWSYPAENQAEVMYCLARLVPLWKLRDQFSNVPMYYVRVDYYINRMKELGVTLNSNEKTA